MKHTIFRFLFFYLFLHISYTHPEGFLAKTSVKTPSEFSYIEQLCTDTTVLSYDSDTKQIALSSIVQIIHTPAHSFIKIIINNSEICCASDQLFYSYNQNRWIKAKDLLVTDVLMNDNGNPIAIDSIECIHQPCSLYALSLKPNHTYCVSERNIVVHNIAHALIIPISMGSIIITVAKTCIFAGTTLLGAHFAKKATHKHYTSDKDIHSTSNNSYYPDPHDPNNDKNQEHPHGIYKDAEYHHKNSGQSKSKCPNDGQRCLDYSLPTDTNQRIAIEGKNFVVLQRTLPGEYHGYIVEWKQLNPKIRNILIKQGLVRKSGKIIKQIMEKSLL